MKKFVLAMLLEQAYIQCASRDDLLTAKIEAADDWHHLSRVTNDMP